MPEIVEMDTEVETFATQAENAQLMCFIIVILYSTKETLLCGLISN